jgi:hypothetical protein
MQEYLSSLLSHVTHTEISDDDKQECQHFQETFVVSDNARGRCCRRKFYESVSSASTANTGSDLQLDWTRLSVTRPVQPIRKRKNNKAKRRRGQVPTDAATLTQKIRELDDVLASFSRHNQPVVQSLNNRDSSMDKKPSIPVRCQSSSSPRKSLSPGDKIPMIPVRNLASPATTVKSTSLSLQDLVLTAYARFPDAVVRGELNLRSLK